MIAKATMSPHELVVLSLRLQGRTPDGGGACLSYQHEKKFFMDMETTFLAYDNKFFPVGNKKVLFKIKRNKYGKRNNMAAGA